MKRVFGAGLAIAALLSAACTDSTPPTPLAAPPVIKSFTASKTRIAAGQSVTLTFTAEHAQSVDLVDQLGASLPLEGDASAGEATVTLDATRFFVLRAKGEGGRDSAFVQVAVDEDLREVFLVAVPPQIESGESAQLVWSAFGAQGAQLQASGGASISLPQALNSGVVDVTPERSQTYSLVAHGADSTQTLSATTELRVAPALAAFEVAPAAARAGETLTLSWKTRGAAEVVVSEATFGELTRATFPAETASVDDGLFAWTVPSSRPSGEPVAEGFPLRFELSVTGTNSQVALTRTVDSYVGDGPRIVEFLAPLAVTQGMPLNLSWRTQNVSRLQVLVGGGVVYEPLATDAAGLENGAFTLPAPAQDAEVTLRVWSPRGGQGQQVRHVRVVNPPSISTFSMPAAVTELGDSATAEWTTQHATSVVLRVKHGPAVFRTQAPAQVQSGSTQVHPGLQTTFVLEAYNDAGEVAAQERAVDVWLPATLVVDPTPAVRGTEVTVEWDLTGAPVTTVVGVSRMPAIKHNPATDFYDLHSHVDAELQNFDDTNDSLARLPVDPSFNFSLAGATHGRFFVSTNGFIAFADVGAQPDNGGLADDTTVNDLLAPFWDDLDVSDGRVLWLLEGQTFPRRLIVQWDEVRLNADPQSLLTFQVQLFESGEVRYGYKTLQGTGAGGESASLGWRGNGSLNVEMATGAPVLAEGDELIWFTSTAPQGQLVWAPPSGGVFNLFGRLQGGAWGVFSSRLNVISAGSVLVNEVLVSPPPAAPLGQWVELLNTSDETVDLSGTRLTSTASGTSFLFPEGTEIAAGDYLLVGQSTDTNDNGDAPVDVVFTDLVLNSAGEDTLLLEANALISEFGWTANQVLANVSLQAPERALAAGGTPLTCDRTGTYNALDTVGTPGAENETCFPYSVRSIPVDYRDVSATGFPIVTTGTSLDEQVRTLNLGVPFTYFGQTFTNDLTISTNGWVSFIPHTAATITNKTSPSATNPTGTISPNWDDLNGTLSAGHNIFARRFEAGADAGNPAAHWVIQWHHFFHFSTSPNDDLNFQVKLFDDGTIEFHYADMVSGTALNYANGNSSTVWLEHPAGTSALPVGVNQPVLTPHSAYRFTPKN